MVNSRSSFDNRGSTVELNALYQLKSRRSICSEEKDRIIIIIIDHICMWWPYWSCVLDYLDLFLFLLTQENSCLQLAEMFEILFEFLVEGQTEPLVLTNLHFSLRQL